VVISILLLAVVASLIFPKKEEAKAAQ
jgi:hypothetical protein